IQPVVKSNCSLVTADGPDRYGADQRTAIRRSGNELQKIDRSGVHASQWDLAVREDRREWVPGDDSPVRRTILNNSFTDCRWRCLAAGTTGQKRGVSQCTGERSPPLRSREVSNDRAVHKVGGRWPFERSGYRNGGR